MARLVAILLLSVLCLCQGQEAEEETGPTSEEVSSTSLDGVWYNTLGSMLILNQSDTGVLTGEYKTAVEVHKGASNGEQFVHGRVGREAPRTFGFVVSFNGGESTTAWSGQYQICDGKETLLTTWILTSHSNSCQDHWHATRVGQDKFTRDGMQVKITKGDKKKRQKKFKIKKVKKLRWKKEKKHGGLKPVG